MHPHLPPATTSVHVTRTFLTQHHPIWPHALLPAGPDWAQAICRCGWTECAESRHDARVLARHHRRYADETWVFHPGWASTIGPREHNADAVGLHVSMTGSEQAWAVADGAGDDTLSAYAAGHASSVAAYVASREGSVAGLLAAADALGRTSSADAVMVVAVPQRDSVNGGWDVAWVGDCRAYEYRRDTDVLTQLTTDHTQGEKLRRDYTANPERFPHVKQIAQAYDHVVLSTVGTATKDSIGHVTTTGPRGRLLLTSDGVHKTIPERSIARAARLFSDAQSCAHKLMVATHFYGTRDNAAAVIVDPVPAPVRQGRSPACC